MKTIIFLIITIISVQKLSAQEWITGKLPKPENSTYYYRRATAIANDRELAVNKALAKVIKESAYAIGVTLNLDDILRQLTSGYDLAVTIPYSKVCEVVSINYNTNQYEASVLAQVATDARFIPKYTQFNDCSTGGKKTAKTRYLSDSWDNNNSVYISGIATQYYSKSNNQYNLKSYGGEIKYRYSDPVGVGFSAAGYFSANEIGYSDFGLSSSLYLGKRNAGIEFGVGYGSNSEFGGHIDIPISVNLWIFNIGYRCSLFRKPTYEKNLNIGSDYNKTYNKFLSGDLPSNISSVSPKTNQVASGEVDYILGYKCNISQSITIGIRLASW